LRYEDGKDIVWPTILAVCDSLRSLALQRGSPSRNCAQRAGAHAKGILMGGRQREFEAILENNRILPN